MKIIIIEKKYFCIIDGEFNYDHLENKFIEKAYVRKNSFAYAYAKKIYKDIFSNANDLKKYYKEYYGEEYDDFTDFLYRKELLDYDDINKLEVTGDKKTILRLNMDINSYNMSTLFECEDDMIEVFNKLLEGLENESA
jgi:hypothetical protein